MDAAAKNKLVVFIKNELAKGHSGVNLENDSLIESGIIDSLGIMKLVQFIESEYGVRIADDELLPENFDSVAQIATLLDSKR